MICEHLQGRAEITNSLNGFSKEKSQQPNLISFPGASYKTRKNATEKCLNLLELHEKTDINLHQSGAEQLLRHLAILWRLLIMDLLLGTLWNASLKTLEGSFLRLILVNLSIDDFSD